MTGHDDPRAIRANHLVRIGHQQGDRHADNGKDQDPDLVSSMMSGSGRGELGMD